MGSADSYGIELLHLRREQRAFAQIGKQGTSNQQWIIGDKLWLLVNQPGLTLAWDCAPANVHDAAFQPLIAQFAEEMIVLPEQGVHATVLSLQQGCCLASWELHTVLSICPCVPSKRAMG